MGSNTVKAPSNSIFMVEDNSSLKMEAVGSSEMLAYLQDFMVPYLRS
jgi:hypothetical protein